MLQPNFIPFPELKTERLLIRRLEKSDANDLFFLRTNEEVLRYLGKEPMQTIHEAEEFIEMINKAINENESILWGIALRENPSGIIGTICIWNIRREHFRGELGYILHPAYWGKGLMKEAINAVLDYGFRVLRLHSMDAMISAGNDASAAVLEKTGFIKEAHFKEDFYFRGKFGDTIVYSKLHSSVSII